MLIVFQDLTIPAAFCFATGMYATGSVPVLLYGTTWRRDLHQVAVHVGHDCNRALATSLRTARALRAEAAWTVAALLILTIPTGDHR